MIWSWPTVCEPTGSKYVPVHRGAEPSHTEGLSVCDQDGDSDEEPENQVQAN